jgi:hypothetical protein
MLAHAGAGLRAQWNTTIATIARRIHDFRHYQ